MRTPAATSRRSKKRRKRMKIETWKDIKGYEGLYQVSDEGNIRSKNGIIRPSKNNSGYLVTHLSKDGRVKSRLVHRIVAIAFLGDVPMGKEVDHINENKLDNRVENLRYLSRFDNASRSTKGVFRKQSNAMEHNPRAKKVVGYIGGNAVEQLSCAKYLSRKYGVNYSTLRYYLQNGGIVLDNIHYRYEAAN